MVDCDKGQVLFKGNVLKYIDVVDGLGIGIFLPWLSIDLLMFDEFFLMPVYFCMAFDWLEASQNQPRSSLPPLGVPQRLQM